MPIRSTAMTGLATLAAIKGLGLPLLGAAAVVSVKKLLSQSSRP